DPVSLFPQFVKNKHFALTFVDAPSCSRCRIQFPFFVTASQAFINDPEVFFARTHDKKLIKEWGVTELPALVFYLRGVEKPVIMNIDVTVDDIIDGIADVLYGDFSGVTREYVLQVNDRNYEELIITPKQNVLLLVYSKPKAEKESIQNFEQVAFAFRKDESILFAKLDAKKYQLLRDEKFKTRETPAVMWLANNEKTAPKRFGGMLSKPLLMQFVNERTNLKRNMEGTLQTDSGRVEAADKIIKENIEDLVEGNLQELKDLLTELRTLSLKLDDFEKELVDYYIYIVDSIALSGKMDTMYDILTFVEEAIAKGDDTPTRKLESLKRQQHILNYFKELEEEYKKGGQKTEKKHKKHRHEHTEL
ncbi:hypothetical protein Btru_053370, partial [Bulinus truncatus]